MERRFHCPSCGAAHLVTNPGILMKICDYCRTAIYWDDESALRAGNKSLELPVSARFKVGASGKLKKESFRVLGRLVYAHDTGTWNEWYVEMQNGSILWLSEDEGELFLEKPFTLTKPVPPFGELQPGMEIALGSKIGVVEEIGKARCIGGEGEIPFQVEIGETYPYADGAGQDGSFSFGLEYDAGTGAPRAFIGRILELKSAKSSPEDKTTPESRVGLIIRCPSCGAPYDGARAPTTEMVVCAACGAGLDLTEAQAKVVGKNEGPEPLFAFPVGTPLTFDKVQYEVMGRLLYDEQEGTKHYRTFEYVLYNPDAGYLWLSEERGHFTLSSPFHGSVAIPPGIKPKQKVRVGQDTFKFFEQGTQSLKWVDGALPWRAVAGESTHYVHLVKPPECIDREKTGREIELFRGRYVGPEEMQAAVPKGRRIPPRSGVYSCQPYIPYASLVGLWKIACIFLILNVLLLTYSCTGEKKTGLLHEKMTYDQYSKEHLTQPFVIKRDGTILRLAGHAPLKNSWLALDFAVVNAGENVITEFSGDASYYYGTDSEGSWSEGSSNFSSYFKIKKAGTYKLLVHATGGSGINGPPLKEPIQIYLYSDVTISWYFFIPLILAGLVTFAEPMGRLIFETRRWQQVAEDDDDD